MIENKIFYTETMADVFRNQGLADKARMIYQYLLEKDPSRIDIQTKLTELDSKNQTQLESVGDTAFLLRRWLELLVRYKQVQRLKAMICNHNGP
jgi:hypothetical protein